MGKPIQWTPDLVDRFWSGVAQPRLSQPTTLLYIGTPRKG